MTETAASITRGVTQSVSTWFKGQKIGEKDGKTNVVSEKEPHPGLIEKGTMIEFTLSPGIKAEEIEMRMKYKKDIHELIVDNTSPKAAPKGDANIGQVSVCADEFYYDGEKSYVVNECE